MNEAVPKTSNRVSTTMRSVLLARKLLAFASVKSARESRQESFRNSSTVQIACTSDWELG